MCKHIKYLLTIIINIANTEVEFLELPLELIEKISDDLNDKTKIVLFSLCKHLYYAKVNIVMNNFYMPSAFIRMNVKFIIEKLKVRT